MSANASPISAKKVSTIEGLLVIAEVPQDFVQEVVYMAKHWPLKQVRLNNDVYQKWSIELRPYTVTELAKQPGMPKRTKLHEIIKGLNVPQDRIRTSSGKLSIEAVEEILSIVSGQGNTSNNYI